MPIAIALARTLLAAVAVSLAPGLSAQAAEVGLARLDCGNEPKPVSVASFSDTYAYPDFKLQLTYSCYLVRHGDRYLLWDTGNPMDGAPEAPKVPLVDLLARIDVPVDAIEFVGISHHHTDHTGQLASFPDATLLMGRGDWQLMSAGQPPPGMEAKEFETRRAPLVPWISGGGKVKPLLRDREDVFGDGSVVMISLPGHTPGHHALLVKLEKTGYVLLTGDVTHFHENYDNDGVPRWNADRADSLASLDRFRKIAKNLDATVIIQHDPRDVSKLPAFPAFAE
ncbi:MULTISPECIES: N-acyl homoserine lactonase family protein [unclassified Lysobacter]